MPRTVRTGLSRPGYSSPAPHDQAGCSCKRPARPGRSRTARRVRPARAGTATAARRWRSPTTAVSADAPTRSSRRVPIPAVGRRQSVTVPGGTPRRRLLLTPLLLLPLTLPLRHPGRQLMRTVLHHGHPRTDKCSWARVMTSAFSTLKGMTEQSRHACRQGHVRCSCHRDMSRFDLLRRLP